MFGLNFNRNNDEQHDKEKHELEQFFENEDWDIGQKGGEVDRDQDQDIDWSNYDFMHTFDDLAQSDSSPDESYLDDKK